MMGLKGESLSYEEKQLIQKEGIGAVILFERNIRSSKGLKNLCAELKSLRLPAPLLIAVDREGGSVDRLRKLSSTLNWPGAEELSARFSLKEVEDKSLSLHQELKRFGINFNLAPCVDVSHPKSLVLKGRTFSSSPLVCGAFGRAFILGARRAGVLSCVKHFPGHGGVSGDTHLKALADTRAKGRIEFDLLPYRQTLPLAGAVMLSHLTYPALDKIHPAPLSFVIVQNYLRRFLSFKGLILTDDLDMKAVSRFSAGEFSASALKAGVNMVLCGQSRKKVFEILEFLKTKKYLLKNFLKIREKEIIGFKKKLLNSPS